MTLDTTVYVHDEVDVGLLFHEFRKLLNATGAHPFKDEPGCIANNCGIGLPAWLMIYHGNGEPLRPDGGACHEYCDGDEHYHEPAHYCRISFDTGYSYKDEQGRGCGDLHACYIAQIGAWLDARSVSWSWKNEFTGEIHGPGDERYARLPDLASGGYKATEWFANVVQPAILARVPEDA